MKSLILLVILLNLISCNQETTSDITAIQATDKTQDTIIMKHKNVLNESYEVGFLSKSYSYYWVTGNDTLPLSLNVNEYEKDSTLSISVHHKEPILFTTALDKLNECLQLVKKDFDLSKFKAIYFRSPIYYPDLAKELSLEYEQKFGRKNISYLHLNDFLLEANLNARLNIFLEPLNKKVKRYGIEKFHLINKESYSIDIPNTDITGYPDFTLHGFGLNVYLTSK